MAVGPVWDVEIARSNRVTRTKAPRSIAPGGLFIVYCVVFLAPYSYPNENPAERISFGDEEQGSERSFRQGRKRSGADFATKWVQGHCPQTPFRVGDADGGQPDALLAPLQRGKNPPAGLTVFLAARTLMFCSIPRLWDSMLLPKALHESQ